MSLPVELLEMIFGYCHLGCRWHKWHDPSLSETLLDFPYSLAAVDPLWNAILLRHQKYWSRVTRAVFNVDSKTPTHIEDAKTLLRHMVQPGPGNHHGFRQFHVAIIRRSKANPDDAAEEERVRKLMDLLAPEMLHFKSILVDVHGSLSLPSVTTYFGNVAALPFFRSLKYLCDVDDSGGARQPPSCKLITEGFHESKVTSMVLDGYTFRRNDSWLRAHKMLKSLTVSHLSHSTVTDEVRGIVDVHEALKAVAFLANATGWKGNLQYLKFRDVKFASRDSMCRAFNVLMCLPRYGKLQSIVFEDADPWFLEDLTRSIFLSAGIHRDLDQPAPMELHLKCGETSREIPIHARRWRHARLVLEGYDRHHLTTSYPFDQEGFLSSELHLINCPGFTDSELETLSRVDATTQNPVFSTNLTYLKLKDCHDFTIQALKNMVSARAMVWRDGSRIAGWEKRRLNSLEVRGYGAPLSAKDKKWFRAHLKDFSWDGPVPRRSLRKLTVGSEED
ncbi:hypothetical protein M413DRAFT_31148 [Hebeloma cylindrosporum]|uniref:F-box domain-containing protein n=1 Tax=Hebeloma cylindrosporum TaxID=76867 RepID=A0A0C3BYW0_HEBCY|nr:hypothetical protein M413DRAFT_31148 [Hebeloma cylindrosporum h7]